MIAGIPNSIQVALGKRVWPHWPLVVALTIVVAVHIPTLGYYFNYDDLVPLGDIRSTPLTDWIRDVLMARDPTPSWRPLTMLVYLIEYKAFGETVVLYRVVHLAVHLVNVALLYAIAWKVARSRFVATFAAAGFGVFGGAWDTVSYITAFPHVLGMALCLVSVYLMVEFVQTGEQYSDLWWGSCAFMVLAFLADEALVVLSPLPPLAYALHPGPTGHKRRLLPIALSFAPLPVAFGVVFLFTRESFTADQRWDVTALQQTWMYVGWLLAPAGQNPIRFDWPQWLAGAAGLGLWLTALWRGPWWARWAALAVPLALLPYVPLEPITSVRLSVEPRYAYVAAPFYLCYLAWAIRALIARASSQRPLGAMAVAAASITLVVGAYSWETIVQNEKVLAGRQPTEDLIRELRRRDPEPFTRVVLVGEPWSNAFAVYAGLPAIRRFLYGDSFAAPQLEGWRPDILDAWLKRRSYELRQDEVILTYRSGTFIELKQDDLRRGALKKLSP